MKNCKKTRSLGVNFRCIPHSFNLPLFEVEFEKSKVKENIFSGPQLQPVALIVMKMKNVVGIEYKLIDLRPEKLHCK